MFNGSDGEILMVAHRSACERDNGILYLVYGCTHLCLPYAKGYPKLTNDLFIMRFLNYMAGDIHRLKHNYYKGD